MIVIDTDILIWILRGRREIHEKFKTTLMTGNEAVCVTPVQIAEIYSGIRHKERLKTENFIDSFNVIDFDGSVGRLAGEFINRYGKSHNVTLADALIAAAIRVNAYRLWTLNRKHYPMLADTDFLE